MPICETSSQISASYGVAQYAFDMNDATLWEPTNGGYFTDQFRWGRNEQRPMVTGSVYDTRLIDGSTIQGHWLQIDTIAPFVPTNIALRGNNASMMPKSFSVVGRMPGRPWELIKRFSDMNLPADTLHVLGLEKQSSQYKNVRLVITQTAGSWNTRINTFMVNAPVQTPTQAQSVPMTSPVQTATQTQSSVRDITYCRSHPSRPICNTSARFSVSYGAAQNAFDMNDETSWEATNGGYFGDRLTWGENAQKSKVTGSVYDTRLSDGSTLQGHWLQIDTIAPFVPTHIELRGSSASMMPRSFWVVGMLQGRPWERIKHFSDMNLSANTLHVLALDNRSSQYNSVRLVITQTMGSWNTRINTFNVY